MKITEVELRRVRIPLVSPFRTSSGTQTGRDALLVHVVTADAEGWGECAAMETPGYSPEYVDGCHRLIRNHLLPRLFAASEVRAASVAELFAPVKGHHMSKAVVETALLDAELRAAGVSLAAHLGAVRDSLDVGVSIGISESIPALIDTCARYVDAGYRRVKLKIEPGWDIEPVRAVRERFPDIALQADANCAYTVDDADHLGRLDDFELVLIEQPLAEDDLGGHAALAGRIRTPICLDESITSAVTAAFAIDVGACSIVNVKAGRVGGYLEARRIHDMCLARGVPVWCGGMLETGIGRAANLALAALPGFTLPGDISASDRYFSRDITPPFVLHDGQLTVPQGPGIGVTPLPEILDELTESIERVAPGLTGDL